MPNRLLHAALAVLLVALPSVAAAQESLTALNDAVTRTVARPDGTATVEVTGTYAGTLTFQVFGLSWGTVDCTPVPTGTAVTSPAANATGKWNCPVSGWASVRVLMSAYTSGTATVRIGFGPGGGVGGSTGGGGGGGDASAANQSTQITSLQLLDNAVGHLTGGAAGTSSLAAGGIYVLTPPTLTNGQQATLRLDATGALVTSGGAAGVTDTDDGSIAGAQVPSLLAALQQAWDGSVWRRVTFGTAGTASAQVTTVQGIASMTPLLGNPGTASLWGVNTLGSTTSGQSGQLGLGAVTTAAPTYTTAQTHALSLTTAGSLRVDVASVGGTTPVAAICDDPAKVTSFNINLTAGTGNTELVALNGSDLIYVCSYALIAGGADGTQFIRGTGTACATGETDVQTMNFAAAGDGMVENGGGSVIFTVPAGNALCVERTSSVTLSGRVSYVRQP